MGLFKVALTQGRTFQSNEGLTSFLRQVAGLNDSFIFGRNSNYDAEIDMARHPSFTGLKSAENGIFAGRFWKRS